MDIELARAELRYRAERIRNDIGGRRTRVRSRRGKKYDAVSR